MAASSKKKAKVIEGSVVETPESEFESASSAETFAAAPVAETFAAAPVAETFAAAPVAETFAAAPVAETFAAAPVAETFAAAPVAETFAAAPVAETFAAAPVAETFAAAPVAETFAAAPFAQTLAAAPVAALAEAPKLYETPAASLGDLRERVRSLIETGINERRVRYANVKGAADEAAHALEASYSSAKHGAIEVSVKALEALRASADANFDFVKAALGAKTASDYVALHGEFARKQIDMLTSQTKAMGELAQKVAVETMEPIKAQVAKTLRLPS